MQSAEWIALFRRVPANLHDQLSIVTTIGTQITIQEIFGLEETYMVIRGRLAGSTDAGLVFFVPYDQINYAGFRKPMKETQVKALFGAPPAEPVAQPAAAPEPPPEPVADVAPEPPAEAAPAPEAEEPAAPAEPATAAAPMPGKAALLERLRARMKGNDKAAPQPPGQAKE
jgi:hypothetical protein